MDNLFIFNGLHIFLGIIVRECRWPFAIWTYGKIEIYFQWYKVKPPFDNIEKRKKILDRLNEIKGIKIPENKIDKRPSFDIKLLKEKSEFDKFVQIYDWFFKEIEKGSR